MTNNHNLCRRRRIYASWLLFLSLSLTLSAQDLLVSGQVTDGQLPISGANVLIKNTNTGVVSDFDGRYTITAKPTDSLQISYLGYTTLTIPIQNRSTINVTLQEDATALGEVKINAGYYTTTDREKTGSIARITAKDIETQPIFNPLEAMQGRLSGVDIVQNSGINGGGFEVKIRGQNSILAGNAPLYIIDGMPLDATSLGSRTNTGTIIPGGNISPLNAINPATIQSIEVLKDADATAIYGSRGANGVVLITTKRGDMGKTAFNLNVATGVAHTTSKLQLLNTQQYLEMRREAFANDGVATYPANAHDINGNWDQNRYTDWQKEFLGNAALMSNVEASVSGGSANTQFLLSTMAQKETTVFPKDFNYQRLNTNTKVNHQSSDHRFELGFSAGYTIENNTLPGNDLTRNATRLAPNAPPLYDAQGNLNWENSTWTNPMAELEGDYKNTIKTLLSNAVVQYNLTEELLAKINLGYTTTQLNDFRTYRHTMFNPAFGLTSNNASRVQRNGASKSSWIIEPQLKWSKKLANSQWSILMGATFQDQEREQLETMAIGFVDNAFIHNISAANTVQITSENKIRYRYQSVFGRINYSLKDKIFINLTGRRDGSSRFGSGNKFGNFGALGAAWIFSEELQTKWLSFGKLRASYGITGNDQINDYQYLQTYTINNTGTYDNILGLDPTRLFNPDFRWEQNKKFEIGLEGGLFHNAIRFTTAYYSNRSSNQLVNYTLPGTTGFSGIQANLDALVENSGWEFDIQFSPMATESFKWQSAVTLSLPKNELLEFPNLENTPYDNQFVVGQPLNVLKMYGYRGVNPETGLFKFEDYNNDGTITSLEDRQHLVDLSPKLFGGLSNTLSYKKWHLDVFFQWVKKEGFNHFYNSDTAGSMSNQPVEVLDRWQQQGDIVPMQQFTSGANPAATLAYNQFKASSAAVSDASFVRLKTLALSYSVPLSKDGSQNCRISLQGQNLLTFTSFKNGDPEQPTRFFLPPLRRISLGVHIQL